MTLYAIAQIPHGRVTAQFVESVDEDAADPASTVVLTTDHTKALLLPEGAACSLAAEFGMRAVARTE